MPMTTGFATKRDFSENERKKLSQSGAALPNGSYPIENALDLKHAIGLMGMGKAPESEIKAHIIARAKSLGLTSHLPASWGVTKRDVNITSFQI